jgi:hypothetical protein
MSNIFVVWYHIKVESWECWLLNLEHRRNSWWLLLKIHLLLLIIGLIVLALSLLIHLRHGVWSYSSILLLLLSLLVIELLLLLGLVLSLLTAIRRMIIIGWLVILLRTYISLQAHLRTLYAREILLSWRVILTLMLGIVELSLTSLSFILNTSSV